MKNQKIDYLIYEGFIITCIWILIFAYFLRMFPKNYVVYAIFAISCAWPFSKLKKSIDLLIDKPNGVRHKDTVFIEGLSIERLEIFRKTFFYNIFFDDDEMPKSYMAFCEMGQLGVREGDDISVSYYPRSRVVTEIVVRKNASKSISTGC